MKYLTLCKRYFEEDAIEQNHHSVVSRPQIWQMRNGQSELREVVPRRHPVVLKRQTF
jgi:hypothetical protein